MVTADDPALELEKRLGHPLEKWEALKARVQDEATRRFADVQDDWLDLMWTLDQYRVASVPPRAMGSQTQSPAQRLGAIYRGKGNWFAELLALLLENRTSSRLAPRCNVVGFSQKHQIDIAWPARQVDPRICAETKVTGAPSFGSYPARGAISDFASRRKELKFAATDLKLYRRQQETKIDHWGAWRENAPPRTYFLWAARLEPGKDNIDRLVREAKALVDTYLDGAGIFAWIGNDAGTSYEHVPLPDTARVQELDDVLHRIASEIDAMLDTEKRPPPVVKAPRPVVAAEALSDDDGA